jgi:hypothetical protein
MGDRQSPTNHPKRRSGGIIGVKSILLVRKLMMLNVVIGTTEIAEKLRNVVIVKIVKIGGVPRKWNVLARFDKTEVGAISLLLEILLEKIWTWIVNRNFEMKKNLVEMNAKSVVQLHHSLLETANRIGEFLVGR